MTMDLAFKAALFSVLLDRTQFDSYAKRMMMIGIKEHTHSREEIKKGKISDFSFYRDGSQKVVVKVNDKSVLRTYIPCILCRLQIVSVPFLAPKEGINFHMHSSYIHGRRVDLQ